MPLFEYTVLDGRGKRKAGFVEAASQQSARESLKKDGLYIVSLSSAAQGGSVASGESISIGRRVSRADLASMTRQLSTLLRAGLPLVQALEALVEQLEKPALRKTLSGVRNLVNEGAAFHEALERYPRIFPAMYVQMCRAGESGGFLERIMERLADTLEKEVRLRGRVMAALVYPIVMTVLGAVFLLFLFAYVVPQVVGIFADFGRALPVPTRILLFVSGLVSRYWIVILAVVLLAVIGWRFLSRSGRFGSSVDALRLRFPMAGKLSLKVATVRLSHILGTLLASGVPLIKSLEVVSDVMGNRILSDAVRQAAVSVSRGGSLADAFRASGVFPPLLPRIVAVGEQSGELAEMLTGVADAYEEEVTRTVQAMTAVLEPALILVMAGVVLFVVVAILLPIFELNQLVRTG
ncbi:MAG: type II secretion system inner membrane protein GspF [bacterium]|nr:type II secretion system inner membrane protein GspF [bacterium]